MSYNTELRELNQSSGIVELYDFDATNIGGGVYHLTPYPIDGGVVYFNGVAYSSFPIASMGWENSASGTAPRPTIQVSNVTGTFLAAVASLGDLVGMSVTRFYTFEKFLDGAAEEDPTARSRPEYYFVEQKLEHTAQKITWQLASPIDRSNLILPRRQYLKDDVANNIYAPGLSRYRGAF